VWVKVTIHNLRPIQRRISLHPSHGFRELRLRRASLHPFHGFRELRLRRASLHPWLHSAAPPGAGYQRATLSSLTPHLSPLTPHPSPLSSRPS
jgi:hypothetical protein